MTELATGFRALQPEYQRLILEAQERHGITLTPLQELSGGWSGALIYLVSAAPNEQQPVRHYILKLDRKGRGSKASEASRHAAAQGRSPVEFARRHLADLALEPVESGDCIGIFFAIAGQSLQTFRTLSTYSQQSQVEAIFAATPRILLSEWNTAAGFEQAVHPQALLAKWLGFRLDAGGPLERFIRLVGRAGPDSPGLLIQSGVYPNPVWYARQREAWGAARPIDALVGLQHGDLNANNILARFSEGGHDLADYYLIDFALFKDQMPLLYDLRYLEMSYLILTLAQSGFNQTVDLILKSTEALRLDPRLVPVALAGPSGVIGVAREAFGRWVTETHPSLTDDLWGQYWLAGAAAGLSYSHKAGVAAELRLAGLIYAAANLRRYAAAFGLPLPVDVASLYDEERPGAAPSSRPAARATPDHLPAAPTPFIGRSEQLATIAEWLQSSESRLLTLTGPGGTGKTRLAVQAAQTARDRFPDGVWFVSLADDVDADQLIARIAQQLDVRATGGQPLLQTVTDYVQARRLLLVLDNFEQLISAAPVAAGLLAAATGLKLLITSRIALNVRGEHELPVPPLDLPLATVALPVDRLAANEAVRLFVERAQAARPDFALTVDNAAVVTQICRRLDGLPLALELAAARLKLLTPQALLARLDDRLKLLTGGARDLPARQQTLRNTLAWSHDLLNPEEQILYARLGVFVGGFSLDAAEAVCNPDGRLDLLEGLTALVNNSLLRREDSAKDEPRFGMLETIRAYALERLAESDDRVAVQERHARFFSNVILNQAGEGVFTPQSRAWLDWLEREHDNIRATLEWSQTKQPDPILAAALAMSLHWFWYRRGYVQEGGRWAERLLTLPAMQTASPPRALALQTSALMLTWQGEHEAALRRFNESLRIWQRLEDAGGVALNLIGKSVALINMGRDSSAQPLLTEALALVDDLRRPFFHAVVLIHLGNVALGQGHFDEAQVRLDQGLAEARAINEEWSVSFALNNLGEVARAQGRYATARAYYEQSEALLRSSGDQGDLARLVHTLGYIAQHEGDHARAEARFRESLALFRRLGNRRGIAECLAGLAGLGAAQGRARWSATLLSAAEANLRAGGGAWWPADRVEIEHHRELIRAALGTEFAAAWDRGQTLTLDQALHLADEGEGRDPSLKVRMRNVLCV